MDATPPLPFIGLNPCRVVDTRGNGFTGQFGPPALVAGASRDFTLAGQCGIPPSASALSLNFTVANAAGAGDIRIYPAGGTLPLVSTLNYVAGQTVANAAVVPVGVDASISVRADVHGTHLIIDVNGYYASYPAGASSFVVGITSRAQRPGDSRDELGDQLLRRLRRRRDHVLDERRLGRPGSGAGDIGNQPRGHRQVIHRRRRSLGSPGNRPGEDGRERMPPPEFEGKRRTRSPSAFSGSAARRVWRGRSSTSRPSSWPTASWDSRGPATTQSSAAGTSEAPGAKFFIEPHPTDASKVIRYISLEGPEAGTYFRGKARIEDGYATIEVPEDFRMVTDTEGLSIQVTPIGQMASVAVMKIDLDSIVIRASRDVEVFYTVNGVRKTQKDLKPIVPGTEFMPRSPDARMPAYLTEGQKAMLISNGTYREDGTVNLETAHRMGWDAIWEHRPPPQRVEPSPN